MSSHEDFSRKTVNGTSSNRAFGFVFCAVFSIIAIWPLLDDESIHWWAALVSAGFAVAAFLVPRVLAPLNRIWALFGALLHRFTNPILLGIIFYVAVTPMALILRVLGKDLLRLKSGPEVASYWIPREPPGPAPETMKHQF